MHSAKVCRSGKEFILIPFIIECKSGHDTNNNSTRGMAAKLSLTSAAIIAGLNEEEA